LCANDIRISCTYLLDMNEVIFVLVKVLYNVMSDYEVTRKYEDVCTWPIIIVFVVLSPTLLPFRIAGRPATFMDITLNVPDV
jgi:hypothetical protein